MKRLINSLQLKKFFYIVKAIKSKIKRWARDYGDICNFYHKELISLICKEFLQIKKNNNLIEKWEESINRKFTERQSKSPKHLGKKNLTSPITREMKIKILWKTMFIYPLGKDQSITQICVGQTGGKQTLTPAGIRFSTTSGLGILVVFHWVTNVHTHVLTWQTYFK